jgi:hypothetical protein
LARVLYSPAPASGSQPGAAYATAATQIKEKGDRKMIEKHQDKELGWYWYEILDSNGEKRLGCTFRYRDATIAWREAIALERIYKNERKKGVEK